MSSPLAIVLFAVSLAVTLSAARLFARRLDRLGVRFGFPEALIGLLTALAADGPELSSALIALAKGAHSTGTGVLIGSCVFNLAAMIGVSALLAGCVRLAREALVLEAGVGMSITVIASAGLLGWLAPVTAAALGGLVLVPYLVVLVGGSELLLTHRVRRGPLGRILVQRRPERRADDSGSPTHHLLALILVDVTLIIAGSAGMVQAALTLGDRWHVSRAILGVLVLGPLTSLPNAVTAIRLGLDGRAAALVGETFNSNTINLAIGVLVPALFVTLSATGATARVALGWMIVMMLTTVAMLMGADGIGRGRAAGLIAMYAGFVIYQLAAG
jgi:cation:H+ antiporter